MLTISACQGGANGAWSVWSSKIGCDTVNDRAAGIRPSVYLKQEVKIIGGNGSDEPYQLAL